MLEIDTIKQSLKEFNIRSLGNSDQAERLAGFLEPDEVILDMVKAENIRMDGKNMAPGRGFLLLVLTQRRLIVGTKRFLYWDLQKMSELSDLKGGRFEWTYNDKRLAFFHTLGLLRWNANKGNTQRFYSSLKGQLARSL